VTRESVCQTDQKIAAGDDKQIGHAHLAQAAAAIYNSLSAAAAEWANGQATPTPVIVTCRTPCQCNQSSCS